MIAGDDLMAPLMEDEERLRDHVLAVPSGDKYWNYRFNGIIQV